MLTNELTKEQFDATCTPHMADVTFADGPAADIWPYIEQLARDGVVLQLVYDNRLVEKVYRNKAAAIDHVLLPTARQHVYVVVLVAIAAHEAYGHYLLDAAALSSKL